MGFFARHTPEEAQNAIVIAKLMQTKCFNCQNSKVEKYVGKSLQVPDIEKIACRDCIEAEKTVLFGA